MTRKLLALTLGLILAVSPLFAVPSMATVPQDTVSVVPAVDFGVLVSPATVTIPAGRKVLIQNPQTLPIGGEYPKYYVKYLATGAGGANVATLRTTTPVGFGFTDPAFPEDLDTVPAPGLSYTFATPYPSTIGVAVEVWKQTTATTETLVRRIPFTLATFTAIFLSPTAGSVGTVINVTGSGFAHPATGVVVFDANKNGAVDAGERSVSVSTSPAGTIATTITVPSVVQGVYPILADVPSGGSVEASANFQVGEGIRGLAAVDPDTGVPTYTMGDTITGSVTPGITPPVGTRHIVRLDKVPAPSLSQPPLAFSFVAGGIFALTSAGAKEEGTYILREVNGADINGIGGTLLDDELVYIKYKFTLTSPVGSFEAHPTTARIISGYISYADGKGAPRVQVYIYHPTRGAELFAVTDVENGYFSGPYIFDASGTYHIRVFDNYPPDAPTIPTMPPRPEVYASIVVTGQGIVVTQMITPHQLYRTGVSQDTWIYLTTTAGAPITSGVTITQVTTTLSSFGFAHAGGGVYRYSGIPTATGLAMVRISTGWGEAFHSVPIVELEVFNPQLTFTSISGPPTVGTSFTLGLVTLPSVPNYPEQTGLRVVTPTGPVSFTAPAAFPLTLTPTMAGEIGVGLSSHYWTTNNPLTAKCLHYSRTFTIKPDPRGLIASVPVTSFTVDQTANISVRVTDLAGTVINNARVTLTGSVGGMFRFGGVVVDSITIDAVGVNTNIIDGVYTALNVTFLAAGTVQVRVEDGGIPPTSGLKALLPAPITVARKLVSLTVEPAGKELVVGVEDNFVVKGVPAGLTMTPVSGVSEITLPNGDRNITIYPPRSSITALTLRWDTPTTRYEIVIPVKAPTVEIAVPHGTTRVLTNGFLEDVIFTIKNPLTGAIIVPSTLSVTNTFDACGLQRSAHILDGTYSDHEINIVSLIGFYGNPNAVGTPTLNFRFTRAGSGAYTLFTLNVASPKITVSPKTIPFGVESWVTVRCLDAHDRPIPAGTPIVIKTGSPPSVWTMPIGNTNAEGVVSFLAFRAPYVLPSIARYIVYIDYQYYYGGEYIYEAYLARDFFEVGPPPPPPPPPAAPTITLSPATTIVRGQSTTLNWTSTNATSVTLFPGVGTVPLVGTLVVSPTVTTTYIFTATGPGGTATASVTITVTDPPPPPLPTITASVSPTSIVRGTNATLTWSTTNATAVSIFPGIGTVPTTGSLVVSPTVTTRYTITATGPGGTVNFDVTLTVTEPPAPRVVELSIGSTFYKVDGVTMIMDAAPYIEFGRTFVPVRFVVTGLGGTVEWDGETRTVIIRFTKPALHIRLVIGEPVAVVGTTIVPIDEDPSVVPVIKGGRTYVPLRFLVERITGSSIEWVPPDVVIMRLPR